MGCAGPEVPGGYARLLGSSLAGATVSLGALAMETEGERTDKSRSPRLKVGASASLRGAPYANADRKARL